MSIVCQSGMFHTALNKNIAMKNLRDSLLLSSTRASMRSRAIDIEIFNQRTE